MQSIRQKIFQIYWFFIYLVTARHRFGYGIHSPIVFSFIHQVLRAKCKNDDIKTIEQMRKRLLNAHVSISFIDRGAGSVVLPTKVRSLRSIVKHSSTRLKYGQVLYNLARWMNAQQILELGTSVGIGTAFLSKGASHGHVTTVEGNPACVDEAQKYLGLLGCANVQFECADFDEIIEKLAHRKYDLIFIDGNHTHEATLRYFNLLLPMLTENGWMVFDDIYWSQGMMNAWKRIQSDERVQVSIDLYKMGLVNTNKAITQGAYRIAYY